MTIPRRTQGFSLVEVTLALGIAVFCLVVVFGLLSVALNTSSISVEQTNATNLLAAIASDLRTAPLASPKGSADSKTAVYQLTVPAAVSAAPSATPPPTSILLDINGRPPTASPAPLPAYQLNVWIMPGVGRGAAIARIVLSWPPSAPLASAAGSVETMVALDRN